MNPTDPFASGFHPLYRIGLDSRIAHTLLFADRRMVQWRAAYAIYLRTDHWATKKAEAYAVHGRFCEDCGWPGGEVHHTAQGYNHLGDENVEKHLRVLCKKCHKRRHGK